MRAAVYVRVSTSEQEENYSLPTQMEGCRRFITQKGWTLDEAYIYQDAFTGREEDRPALNRLMEAARREAFDVVVVYAYNRLARRVRTQNYIMVQLQKLGGVIVEAVLTPDDGSKSFEARRNMEGMFSEWERDTFMERSIRGRIERVKKGKYPVGPFAPYGYAYADDEKTRLMIVEDEAHTIRWIFDRAIEGWGVTRIGNRLRDERVPHRSGKTSWYPSSVRAIIRSELYKGKVYGMRYETIEDRRGKKSRKLRPREEWIETPDVAPAIVSETTWERANVAVSGRLPKKIRESKNPNLMLINGEAICGVCRTAMLRVGGMTGRHYKDSKDRYVHCHHASEVHKCKKTAVNGDILDTWAWDKFVEWVCDPDRVQKVLNHDDGEVINPFTFKVDAVKTTLAQTVQLHAEKSDALIVLAGRMKQGSKALDSLIAEVESLEEQIAEMENDLRVFQEQEAEVEQQKTRMRELNELLVHLPARLRDETKITLEMKRDFMQAFHAQVEVFPRTHSPRFRLYVAPSVDSIERLLIAQDPASESIEAESLGTRSLRNVTFHSVLIAAA